jgi:hypothetical protein
MTLMMRPSLISSVGGGRGGGRGAAAEPADANRPMGAIAFALPRKDSNSSGDQPVRSVK